MGGPKGGWVLGNEKGGSGDKEMRGGGMQGDKASLREGSKRAKHGVEGQDGQASEVVSINAGAVGSDTREDTFGVVVKTNRDQTIH
jgi:hypothetical protein